MAKITGAILALLLLASRAQAVPFTQMDSAFGPGTVTMDNATGLRWLSLGATVGWTVGEVNNLRGWRWATDRDLGGLIGDFFGSEWPTPTEPHAKQFVSLFGATKSDGPRLQNALYDPAFDRQEIWAWGLWIYGPHDVEWDTQIIAVGANRSNPSEGHWLVATVPEPGTMALLITGLVGLILLRLRHGVQRGE